MLAGIYYCWQYGEHVAQLWPQHQAPYAFRYTNIIGNVLILIGVICAAFYSIYSQRQLIDIDPWQLIALHQLSGFLLVLGVWLISLPIFGTSIKANSFDLLLAIISGITAYALPFFLYLIAIKGLGAAKTSILLALPPIFTIWGSFIVFKEQLSWIQWIGVGLTLSAVSIICVSKSKDTPSVAIE